MLKVRKQSPIHNRFRKRLTKVNRIEISQSIDTLITLLRNTQAQGILSNNKEGNE